MALQIWLPLVKDIRNQGKCNLNFTNNNATYVSTGGKLGGCYTFNNQTISATPSTTLKNSFSTAASIACWVKVSSSHAAWAQCVTFGAVSTTVSQIYFGIRINSSGVPYGYVGNGSTYTQCTFTTAIKDNTWHHLCLTYTTGTIKSYLDGELKTTTSTNLTPNWTNATVISIGGNSTQTFKNNDAMNDVRIYNHCLTPIEVNYLAQGLRLLYTLNNKIKQPNILNNANDLTLWPKEGGISVEWDSNVGMYKLIDTLHTSSYYGIYQDVDLSANTTYTFSVEGKAVDQVLSFGLKEGASGYPQNGANFTTITQRLSVSITTSDSATRGRVYLFIKPTSNGTNYGYFNLPILNLGSSVIILEDNIEYDSSGYCNNGIKTGTLSYSSDTPKYASSTSFDSSASITSSGVYDKTTTLSEYTIATWVKIPTSVSTSSYFYKGLLDLYITTNKKLGYTYGTSSSGSSGNSVNLVLDGWTHIVITYNSSRILKFYINGEQKSSITATLYPRHTTDVLGYSNFTSSMSDFRIYSTALSDTDVMTLYQNCMTIDPDGTIRGRIRRSGDDEIVSDITSPIIGTGQIGYARL